MDKYNQNGRIPKNTKVSMTIFMINLLDLAVVGGLGFVGLKMSEILRLSPLFSILNIGFSIILGIVLVVRTPAAPQIRNIFVIYNALKMNRKKYFPIKFEERGNEDV